MTPDLGQGALEAAAPAPLAWARRAGAAALVLAGFAVLYVGATFWLGRASPERALSALLARRDLPLILGLVALGIALRALRWLYYGRRLGWQVPALPSVVVFIASFALTATPGKAGELLKSALLRRRYGVPVAESAGALIVERLGDLLALLILAAGGLLRFPGLRLYFLMSLALVAAICVLPRPLGYPALRWAGRRARLAPLAERLRRILDTIEGLLRPGPFALGLMLAVIAWSAEATAFYLLTRHLAVAIPVLTAFSICGLAAVAGALSMLPGGLGGVEAVMVLLLTELGVELSSATVTVIVFRLSTLYLTSLVGLGFLGLWRILPALAKPVPRSAEA